MMLNNKVLTREDRKWLKTMLEHKQDELRKIENKMTFHRAWTDTLEINRLQVLGEIANLHKRLGE